MVKKESSDLMALLHRGTVARRPFNGSCSDQSTGSRSRREALQGPRQLGTGGRQIRREEVGNVQHLKLGGSRTWGWRGAQLE